MTIQQEDLYKKNIKDLQEQLSRAHIRIKVLTEEQFYDMEEMIRFHSGQWSTDISKDKKFDFNDYNPETMFIHMLDMMSTADLIQTDVRE